MLCKECCELWVGGNFGRKPETVVGRFGFGVDRVRGNARYGFLSRLLISVGVSVGRCWCVVTGVAGVGQIR